MEEGPSGGEGVEAQGPNNRGSGAAGRGEEGEEQIMEFEVEPAGSGEPVAVLQGSEGL